MPTSYPIPPWLHGVSPNTLASVTASGLQAGGQLGLQRERINAEAAMASARLAEQRRQNDMEAAYKKEALQAQILRAQAELASQNAYRQMSLSLRQAQIEEAARHNAEQAQMFAERTAMYGKHYDEMARNQEAATAARTAYQNKSLAMRRGSGFSPEQQEAWAKAYQDFMRSNPNATTQEAAQHATVQARTITPGTIGMFRNRGGTDPADVFNRMMAAQSYKAMALAKLGAVGPMASQPTREAADKLANEMKGNFGYFSGQLTNRPPAPRMSMPIPPPAGGGAMSDSERMFLDNEGNRYRYIGDEDDPFADDDPENWEQLQ